MFERVLADECALDPTIDVVKTLNLSRDEILKRMPHNVKTLRRLIQAADADFRTSEAPARPRPATGCAATSTAGCARRSSWPRNCRRASTCSTAGPTSWRVLCPADGRPPARDRRLRPLRRRPRAPHQARQAAARPEAGDALQPGRPDRPGPRAGTPPQALSEGPPRAGRGQPAAGGVDRQALPQPRPAVLRPDPGRQPRPDAGRGQVRAPAGLQVRHLRDLVDSPGHHPRPGRPRPHHPRAVPSGRHAGRGGAGARRAVGRAAAASRRSRRSRPCWA